MKYLNTLEIDINEFYFVYLHFFFSCMAGCPVDLPQHYHQARVCFSVALAGVYKCQSVYLEKRDKFIFIRKPMALPYLPAVHDRATFIEFESQEDARHSKTWLHTSGSRGSTAERGRPSIGQFSESWCEQIMMSKVNTLWIHCYWTCNSETWVRLSTAPDQFIMHHTFY